jgi:hypothetical protein
MIMQRNMNSYFMQREGGRLYRIAKTDQQEYGAEFVSNISSDTNKICNKVVEHFPCLTVRRRHHGSIILTYTFFVPPDVPRGSFRDKQLL